MAEIKGPKGEESDRKYSVVAEAGGELSVKWSVEVEGKGSYTFEALSGSAAAAAGSEKEKKENKGEKKKKGAKSSPKVVEIEEEQNPGAIVIMKDFSQWLANKWLLSELKADVGASKTYPQQAREIWKNGYILIKGRPCKGQSKRMENGLTLWPTVLWLQGGPVSYFEV